MSWYRGDADRRSSSRWRDYSYVDGVAAENEDADEPHRGRSRSRGRSSSSRRKKGSSRSHRQRGFEKRRDSRRDSSRNDGKTLNSSRLDEPRAFSRARDTDDLKDYTLDNPLVSALINKTRSAEKELRAARKKAARAEAAAAAARAQAAVAQASAEVIDSSRRHSRHGSSAGRHHRRDKSHDERRRSGHGSSSHRASSKRSSRSAELANDKRLQILQLERDTRELEVELQRLKKQREAHGKSGKSSSPRHSRHSRHRGEALIDSEDSSDGGRRGSRRSHHRADRRGDREVLAVDEQRRWLSSPQSPRRDLGASRRETELMQTIVAKESEATKLRLDVHALENRAHSASERSAAAQRQVEELQVKLQETELSFEQREVNLAAQAKAYKQMVGDMHRVLESAERKRARYVLVFRGGCSRRSTVGECSNSDVNSNRDANPSQTLCCAFNDCVLFSSLASSSRCRTSTQHSRPKSHRLGFLTILPTPEHKSRM